MVEVWLIELERSAAALEAEEARRPRLSSDDLDRIGSLKADDMRQQRRLTTIALRGLIAARVGAGTYDRVPFRRLVAGKPVLDEADVSFSISHANGRALIALGSANEAVGIDLEARRELRLSEARRAVLIEAGRRLGPLAGEATVPAGDAAASVLQAWVRLEAVAKALGCGIGRVLSAAGVLARGSRQSGDADGAASPESFLEGAQVAVVDLALPADASQRQWFAALAVSGGAVPINAATVTVQRFAETGVEMDRLFDVAGKRSVTQAGPC